MKLKRLSSRNFRGLENGEYTFTDRSGEPFDVVVVTGGPHRGKTALLEAIIAVKESIGPYGFPPSSASSLRRGEHWGHLQASWLLTEEEAKLAKHSGRELVTDWHFGKDAPNDRHDPHVRALFARYSRDPMQCKFEYFPSNRRLARGRGEPPARPLPEPLDAAIRLTRDADKYARGLGELAELVRAEALRTARRVTTEGIALHEGSCASALHPYNTALEAFSSSIRIADAPEDPETVRLVLESGDELGIDELSAVEEQELLFAMTFTRLGLRRSVVLVDEPELHVHPTMHGRFTRGLLSLTHNQTFLATSSPDVCAVVQREQVIDLR